MVRQETFHCCICDKNTLFTIQRTPEYTKSGESVLNRGVMYSDGTCIDGKSRGNVDSGVPGVNATYTGYHWTKSTCNVCGTLNSNYGPTVYSLDKNLYRLNDCAESFLADLEPETAYHMVDSTHHQAVTTGGQYCNFCFGTRKTIASSLEPHTMERTIVPQLANQRFVVKDTCSLCGYAETSYVAAKSVIANYYGVVDGQPHTLTVSDLSEAGVKTQIRYGNSADACTLSSAPNYTEEGQYTVYYEIAYTYDKTDMIENGVAYVWLRGNDAVDSSDPTCGCGCGDKNCGCTDKTCDGGCCADKGCGDNHNFTLLDSIPPTCRTLGYDRYLCANCGRIEKRDYKEALGHAWQEVVIRDATCETDGKKMDLCARCGEVKVTATPRAEHRYKTYPVAATCTSSGYTVQECTVCGERTITNLTNALPHDYKAIVTPATCETGGQALHRCEGCGSSFVTDIIEPLGHSWDEGKQLISPTCTGEGLMEYHCTRCNVQRLEQIESNLSNLHTNTIHKIPANSTSATDTIASSGHIAGPAATCTTPQTCTVCGAVLAAATGHHFYEKTTAPTCTTMGYTVYTCVTCGLTNKGDYVDALGHNYRTDIKAPTCTEGGHTTYACTRCDNSFVTDYREALDHKWDSGTRVVNSTCNGAGMTEYRCTRCDAVRLESESATGHTPGTPATCTDPQLCTVCGAVLAQATGHHFQASETAPTCTEIGFTTESCTSCGLSYQSRYTNPLGHKYTSKVTAPTCTEPGFTTYTCERCGDSYTADNTDPLDHKWDSGTTVSNPTCNGAGVKEYRCVRCDAHRLEAESETGHTPSTPATCTAPQLCMVCGAVLENALGHEEKAEITPPTCTEMGFTTWTCTRCHDSHKGEYLKPLGHNYTASVTDPTCTEPGFTTYTCEHCGDTYIADHTDALGHKWDKGTRVVNSTCNGGGMTEYRCVRCDIRRLEAESETGHTPGTPATCTDPQLCTVCGAVLKNALGHEEKAEITPPTCTEMGYTTWTCTRCHESHKGEYTKATGHKAGDWIVDQEPTTTSAGKRHTVCVTCGEVLETEELEKYYQQAVTDTKGEAVTGVYLIIVTDTATGNPVQGAAVTLNADSSLSVRLPEGRLLDYAAQTTVTVLLAEKKSAVTGMPLTMTDKNGNYGSGATNKDGQVTLPVNTGKTGGNGTCTLGYQDPDGGRATFTVKLSRHETGRPIVGAAVAVGTTGNLTVTLPDGIELDGNHRIDVVVTNQEKVPQNSRTVILKGDLSQTVQGRTNKDGKLTLPDTDSAYTDTTGTALLGQYTVLVTDKAKKPVVKALVTLGNRNGRDAFTVLLPEDRLLDANDQTVITVLLSNGDPAIGLYIRAVDSKDNYSAKNTNKDGQVMVPDATGAAGESVGTDTENSTVNVKVVDRDGKPVENTKTKTDKDGTLTITLPDAFTFEADGPVTVTVTDNHGGAKPGVSVTVEDGAGVSVAGITNKNGTVTVPGETHAAYLIGYPDGTIGPERNMTRSEAAAVFARILSDARGDSLDRRRSSRFPDVKRTMWYFNEVAYLEQFGVITGYPDGQFHGEDSITRREFVAMCSRLQGLMELHRSESTHASFQDIASDWAAEEILEAARNGWVIGRQDGGFHGGDLITRAEVATIINRMLGRAGDKTFLRQHEDALITFSDLRDPHYWAYYDLMEAANGHTTVSGAPSETWYEAK